MTDAAATSTEAVDDAIVAAEEDKGRKSKTHERLNILKIVTYSISILSDIVGIITNSASNYYWYFLGRNFSGVITKTFILVDYIIASNMIVPTDPWRRYRYGPHYKPEPADCGVCNKEKLTEAGAYEKCEKQRIYCVSHIDDELHTYNDIKVKDEYFDEANADANDLTFDGLF